MYKDSCEEFIRKLHSSAPVPGGGGASALMGAAGMALGGMVMSLRAESKNAGEDAEERNRALLEAEELEKTFLELMNKDAEGFLPLSNAYRLPKTTEEEKAERTRVMQEALVLACEAPMEMMRTAVRSLDLLARCLALGSKLAVSDVGVGAAALRAAADGAYLNVLINAKMIRQDEMREKLLREANAGKAEAEKKADALYTEVLDRI